MRNSGASSVDPNYLPSDFYSYSNVSGRTLVDDPRLVPGENTAVIVRAGQSVGMNYSDSLYTCTESRAHNLSISNGGVYLSKDPLLGADGVGGGYGGRLSDALITNGVFDRVVDVPIGVGGTQVAGHAPGTVPPAGVFFHRYLNAISRLAALGLTPTMFLWDQGQADVGIGTTQANYLARLTALIAAVRALGVAAPWFIAKSTYPATDATAVRAAQAAIVNPSNLIYAGPDLDTLTGRWDGTHMNDTDCAAAALLWRTSISALF